MGLGENMGVSLKPHKRFARKNDCLYFPDEENEARRSTVIRSPSQSGFWEPGRPAVQHTTSGPTLTTMSFGEYGAMIKSCCQTNWQNYSQLTKNKVGICFAMFISPFLWDSISTRSVSPSLSLILKKKKIPFTKLRVPAGGRTPPCTKGAVVTDGVRGPEPEAFIPLAQEPYHCVLQFPPR